MTDRTAPADPREALARALDELRVLDGKHFPTTRAKRPDWEVCDHDSMTWPCETQKALDAFEVFYAEYRVLAARQDEPSPALRVSAEVVEKALAQLDAVIDGPDGIVGSGPFSDALEEVLTAERAR